MEYHIERLLPIVAELSVRYTSGESCSVSYEAAQALMEAVIYCIRECVTDTEHGISAGRMPHERELYDRGAHLVIQKTLQAKEIYESILPCFHDYGCANYRDTILKGMPEFFVRYDPVFFPGNHLLTLDYPLLNKTACLDGSACQDPLPQQNGPRPLSPLRGIDLIFKYLKSIAMEVHFLNRFHPDTICRLMERVSPDYRELYLDNLCEPVLLCTVSRLLAAEAAGSDFSVLRALDIPLLTVEECNLLRTRFLSSCVEEICTCIKPAIRAAVSRIPGAGPYFEQAASDYAARIRFGIDSDCLETVLYASNQTQSFS